MRLGDLGQRHAVAGEQRLVGGDDVAAGFERCLDAIERGALLAADQLDEEVDVRRAGERHRVVDPAGTGEVDAALLRPVAGRHGRHHEVAAALPLELGRLLGKHPHHRGADGAEPGNSHPQSFGHQPNGTPRTLDIEMDRQRRADSGTTLLGSRALDREEALDVAGGLADAVLVLDQRDAHVVVAVLAEADARRDRDVGVLDQQLGELQRAELAERLGDRRPGEHRGRRRGNLPAGAAETVDHDVAAACDRPPAPPRCRRRRR